MPGFSQSERRGLERMQRASGAHPDPDLLTAFSEQAATPREREQVLAHLATCEQCRQVVSLSAPLHPERLVTKPAPRPALWRWPVLRWGVVAASAVIVMFAVSLGTRERKASVAVPITTETAPIGDTVRKTPAPQAAESGEPSVPASAGVKAPQVRYEKVAPQRSDTALDASTTAQHTATEEKAKDLKKEQSAAIHGTGGGGQFRGSAVGGMVATSAPAATGGVDRDKLQSQVIVARSLPSNEVADAKPVAPSILAGNVPAPASEPVMVTSDAGAAQNTAPFPQKEAAAPPSARVAAKARAATAQDKLMNEAAGRFVTSLQSPAWQVSSEGYLLNSQDNGANWTRQLPDQRFTKVQNISNHVWAITTANVLLHSTDNGNTWSQVRPVDNKSKSKGTVIDITFLDVNHGILKTSTGETWSTVDGGYTWKKQ